MKDLHSKSSLSERLVLNFFSKGFHPKQSAVWSAQSVKQTLNTPVYLIDTILYCFFTK